MLEEDVNDKIVSEQNIIKIPFYGRFTAEQSQPTPYNDRIDVNINA